MTKEEYRNEIDGRPCVVKFSAEWCNPCRVLGKTFEKIEPIYPNVKFIHVDVEDSEELVNEFQITNIPVVLFIKENGEISSRKVGLIPEKGIISEIERLISE